MIDMPKIIKSIKETDSLTIELTKSELVDLMDSVECMTEKEQRKLLENIPSTEEGRSRLDRYKAINEDLKKIFEHR